MSILVLCFFWRVFLHVQCCFMAHATTPVKCHDVACAAWFSKSSHEVARHGEQPYEAVHSRPFGSNLPVLKWMRRSADLFAVPFQPAFRLTLESQQQIGLHCLQVSIGKGLETEMFSIHWREGKLDVLRIHPSWACLDFGGDHWCCASKASQNPVLYVVTVNILPIKEDPSSSCFCHR